MQQAPANTQKTFQEAIAHHQQGRLAAAEQLYEQILRDNPEHFDALHLVGVIGMQTGRSERCVEFVGKAIEINPNVAAAHSNLSVALQAIGRHEDALASCDRAIALTPDYVEAHYNRGNALGGLGRHDEALASYDRAIALKPDHPSAYNNRGNVLRVTGRADEALQSFSNAIRLQPESAEAYNNRGNALSDIGRFEDALADYDSAVALRPDYAEGYNNRGNALRALNRFDEALASCDKAIALKPEAADLYINRGNALTALKRIEETLSNCDTAIRLRPDFIEAHYNRGGALSDLMRFDEAIASYDRAIALKPDYADAHTDKSLALLATGQFKEGWRLYEWRKKKPEPCGARAYVYPEWTGSEALSGKTVFLHWEQGFGDTIQFCRYANMVRGLGAKVFMSVQNPLVRLLRQLEPDIEVLREDEAPVSFDFHCPLMSLPLAFDTTPQTMPSEPSYLIADAKLKEAWGVRLPPKDKPRIGLAWSGSPVQRNNHNRLIEISELEALLAYDAHWVSLQKDMPAEDAVALERLGQISVATDSLTDFAETAALIDQLDLVITVDTSVAHLAGALGKPVWILLAFHPDWRWLSERPWYPSARLFRQSKIGDWSPVIEDVKAELAALSREKRRNKIVRR